MSRGRKLKRLFVEAKGRDFLALYPPFDKNLIVFRNYHLMISVSGIKHQDVSFFWRRRLYARSNLRDEIK